MHSFTQQLILTSLLTIGLFIQSSLAFSPAAGHRLHLTNIEIIKQKSKTAQIYVDIVNTGRFDIKMGKGKRMPYLEVTFDNSLSANELDGFSIRHPKSTFRKRCQSKSRRNQKAFFPKI